MMSFKKSCFFHNATETLTMSFTTYIRQNPVLIIFQTFYIFDLIRLIYMRILKSSKKIAVPFSSCSYFCWLMSFSLFYPGGSNNIEKQQ
jgi:hypothetical protein